MRATGAIFPQVRSTANCALFILGFGVFGLLSGSGCAAIDQPAATVATENSLDGRALLAFSLAAHGPSEGHAPLALAYRGRHFELGDFVVPFELREYDARETVWFGFDGSIRVHAVRSHEESGAEALPAAEGGEDTAPRSETEHSILELEPASSYALDFDAAVQADSERARIAAQYRWAERIPSLYLSLALSERGQPRYLGRFVTHGRLSDVVAFEDRAGSARSVVLDPQSHRLRAVESFESDPLFGDDLRYTEYAELRAVDSLLVAVELRRHRLWFVEDELLAQPTLEPLPARCERASARSTRSARAVSARVAPRLFELRLAHLDHRALFLELDDHVVVFEAPLSSEAGELMLEEIARRSGDKPVQRLFLGHPARDSVGGIRPFVARGIPLVTTPGNVEFLQRIAAAPRGLEPDLQSFVNRAPALEIVRGQRRFEQGHYPVEVYDIGPYTVHSDEYLVFYFPVQRVLFEGDLISPPLSDQGMPARDRAIGLLRAIDELRLDVDRIYESHPVRGRASVTPIARLRELVAQRTEPKPTAAAE